MRPPATASCAAARSIGSRLLGRQVVHRHSREDFLFEQRQRVGRRDPELGRQPRGDGVELEAAVPRRRGIRHLLLGDGVHQRLRRRALRAEVDEPGEDDARVEEDAHGQRLRSSSTSVAMSSADAHHATTVGRATSRRPTFTSFGPAATRSSRTPSVVLGDLELRTRRQPGPLADAGRNDHPACLVNGSPHAISLPSMPNNFTRRCACSFRGAFPTQLSVGVLST